MTGNMDNENSKIAQYERIRIIQDEMMNLADEAEWLRIEQRVEPDPLDMVASRLYGLDQLAVGQQMRFSGQSTASPPDTDNSKVRPLAADETEVFGNGHTEEFA